MKERQVRMQGQYRISDKKHPAYGSICKVVEKEGHTFTVQIGHFNCVEYKVSSGQIEEV